MCPTLETSVGVSATMSDRGLYRGVHSSLLDDREFRQLEPEARHVFQDLRLGREAGPGCIWQMDEPTQVSLLAGRTGYRPAVVRRALDALTRKPTPQKPWLFRDLEAGVWWVRNGLRHDPNMNLTNPTQLVSVVRSVLGLPPSPLVEKFLDYYGIRKAHALAHRRGLKALSHGVARARASEDRERRPRTRTKTENEGGSAGGGQAAETPKAAQPTGSAPGHSRDQGGADPSPCAVEQGSIGGDTAYQCSVTGRTWSQGSTVPARCPGHPSANGPPGARQGTERLDAVLSRVLADQPKPAGPDANDAPPTGPGGPDAVGVQAPGRPGVAGPLGSAGRSGSARTPGSIRSHEP
jgi:hypothetical protein